MVKFYTFAAIALATVLATASATPALETEGIVAETVPGSSPLEKRQRKCCKTSRVTCDLILTNMRNPDKMRAIWTNENGSRLTTFDYSASDSWKTDCRNGYCYSVHGRNRTCKYWVQSYPDNPGQCTATSQSFPNYKCKPSFCAVYC